LSLPSTSRRMSLDKRRGLMIWVLLVVIAAVALGALMFLRGRRRV
jgi:hypothetical protein